MAFIRSLHEKNFCLRTIQLSPSCRSPLPRIIRVWLLPHLRMLPLSTGSACSATHDLSLFKPHLKTISSFTMSSSRSRRALLDNISCQSSSQRSSSPFRLYSGRRDDSRFQKRCSVTPLNGEVVGIKSLVPLWWSATALSAPGWLRGFGVGLLDSGDSAGWLSDPLRP